MKITNVSKGPLYLESGTCAPGDCGEATPVEYALLKSNHRIEDYVHTEPPKAPAPPTKAAPKKAAAKGKQTPKSTEDFL